jgi:hypothetical protein
MGRWPVLGVALVLTARPSARLTAQASISASLGARYTSTLVHDSIVAPFDVRASIAPAFAATVGLPLNAPWQLELELDLSTGVVQRHDVDGSTAPITHLTTLGVTVGLGRQLRPWLVGRVAVGGLKYLPSESVGLFRDGSGGVIPYGRAGVDIAPPIATRHHVALQVTGDVHRLLTPALRNDGFVESRVVYRLSVGVRADLWRRS